MSDPYGHTEATLPDIQDLIRQGPADPADVREALNESLGIGARRVRYRPPDGGMPDVHGLAGEIGLHDW
jgi:hypothetical protein